MSTFKLITLLIIIVAILLVGVILLQEPKERVTPSGGGAASIQRVGINQKADFLEKATWVLVGLLLVLTLLSALFLKDAPQSTTSISPNLAKLQAQQQATNTIDSENTGSPQDALDDQVPSSNRPSAKESMP
ncbi:preprotein translocase subunit SecG [Cardinium endosymbiont of Tipula unca]|uniref:preprotein translocase subunit SecG n=1 Tax=Cardinium endosymbiont of Tipula unca TaxID=3066216 RepID=UPI0030D550A2